MGYSITDHKLHLDGNPVDFTLSPNGSGTVRPLYLIIHYTAGTTASGAINHFKNPEAKASAHIVLDLDGTATQMAPFNRITWHAGRSEWKGIDGLNGFSIGIEIVNAGKLTKSADGRWKTWSDNVIPEEEVLIARHKNESSDAGWQLFTADQIRAVVGIGTALNSRYNFLDVLGHDDIAPTRKVDPGPAFPFISVAGRIMGRQ